VIKTGSFPRSICTDGSRIYFSVFTGAAKSEIAQVSQAGGETSVVPVPLASPVILDCSAVTSAFMLASGLGLGDVPLWTQPIPSGSATRIDDLSAHGASWSPDANQIVLSKGNSLYLASSFGVDVKLLASFDPRKGEQPFWPRWSPDGKVIRFSLHDRKLRSNSLWEIPAAGGEPRRLLSKWKSSDSCCGTWMTDGKYFVFVSSQGERSDLWALPADASWLTRLKNSGEPVQLTAGPLSYSAPLPGRVGHSIFAIGETQRGELMRYDPPSENFVPVAPGVSAAAADFSRDGKKLAFVSFREGSLWRSRSDGSEKAQLSFGALQTRQPRWSPDGAQIAFYGFLRSQPAAIYVIPESGGPLRKLISRPEHEELDPDWSPDGNKLVFSDLSSTDDTSELNIVDLRTGQVSVLEGSLGMRSPRWSLDGQYISALSVDLSHLFLYQCSTNRWEQVASFRMGYPNWSQDSKYLYLVSLANRTSICRVSIADHQVSTVVDMTPFNQYWTNDAWLGLAPNDSPLLSRDVSIQQLFDLHWVLK
jgi:Tol biopolymer transport system component